ncbi:outer membrane beta-barrel protein [candidate division KSB1 bacterium]
MVSKVIKSTIIVVLSFIVFNTNNLKAQSFKEGKSFIQAGYGVGNFMSSIFQAYQDIDEDMTSVWTGPLFAKFEYALTDKIGMGVNIAYAGATVSYEDAGHLNSNGDVYKETITWSNISFLIRMNLHFGKNKLVDPYWGFGLGYRTGSTKYENNDNTYNSKEISSLFPLGLETTLGIRVMFAQHIGMYIEAGIAKAVLQGGLTVSF